MFKRNFGVLRRMIYWVLGCTILYCLLMTCVSCASRRQPQIGLVDGRLRDCPTNKSNCVCSESAPDCEFYIEPLKFSDSQANAWDRAKMALIEIGGKIQVEEDYYLHSIFVTKVFRFVDDLELRMDVENNNIQIRSASRVGYSDLGVNRKRVERLREQFAKLK